jgi:hypothetical protein
MDVLKKTAARASSYSCHLCISMGSGVIRGVTGSVGSGVSRMVTGMKVDVEIMVGETAIGISVTVGRMGVCPLQATSKVRREIQISWRKVCFVTMGILSANNVDRKTAHFK